MRLLSKKIAIKQIPLLLIFSRFVIGFAILLLSIFSVAHYQTIAIILLTIGLLTDIFDGVIARHLNISSQKLRRLDSTVDQVFFISIAAATYLQCPLFFKLNALKLCLLLSLEGLTYLISYLKFKKEIATHSIGAKIWTLLLFGTLVQIMLTCTSGVLFDLFWLVGIITRIEIIAIILALRNWENDVPTFYHALRLRKNKPIKRHKLFNG